MSEMMLRYIVIPENLMNQLQTIALVESTKSEDLIQSWLIQAMNNNHTKNDLRQMKQRYQSQRDDRERNIHCDLWLSEEVQDKISWLAFNQSISPNRLIILLLSKASRDWGK